MKKLDKIKKDLNDILDEYDNKTNPETQNFMQKIISTLFLHGDKGKARSKQYRFFISNNKNECANTFLFELLRKLLHEILYDNGCDSWLVRKLYQYYKNEIINEIKNNKDMEQLLSKVDKLTSIFSSVEDDAEILFKFYTLHGMLEMQQLNQINPIRAAN